MATKNNIVDGFPALKKLGFPTGKRAVPFVQQLEWTDCGAASLCMVMAYYGRETKLAEVRDAMGIGRAGVSAKAILDTAERYGLTGRGIKVDTSQIKLVKTGTILHWEFNHFVVFDRIVNGAIRIVDPATGPRDVPVEQFGKAFTGVAIELIPTDRFTKTKREKGRLTRYVQELMSEKGLFSRIITISLALSTLPAEPAMFLPFHAEAEPQLCSIFQDSVKHSSRAPAGAGLITVFWHNRWNIDEWDTEDSVIVDKSIGAARFGALRFAASYWCAAPAKSRFPWATRP